MIKVFGQERPAFLGDLLDAVTERGRALLGLREAGPVRAPDLAQLGEVLVSRRGEASGVALAQSFIGAYAAAPMAERLAFLHLLAAQFGPDVSAVDTAIAALNTGEPGAIEALHAASEPRRLELFRRLNVAPGGTQALLRMREDLLGVLRDQPELRPVNADFTHLFGSWFNRGFLSLRQIDWTTPANILEKIIQYEAVHEIQNWDDLRNRLQPQDRRCYAFFHPQLPDEPLIFVEVALTVDSPRAVAPLLDLTRQPIAAETATTAVFYSISNTQRGLAGVSFGNFLIKQVVELLKAELPQVKTFVTLSPVPGFAAWLAGQRDNPSILTPAQWQALDTPDWHRDPECSAALAPVMTRAAAQYFLAARDARGRPVDAVARFHLGNGARLDRLNLLGDLSANGMRQSHGLMVNYRYALDAIERNHEAFAESGTIAASDEVKRAAPSPVSS